MSDARAFWKFAGLLIGIPALLDGTIHPLIPFEEVFELQNISCGPAFRGSKHITRYDWRICDVEGEFGTPICVIYVPCKREFLSVLDFFVIIKNKSGQFCTFFILGILIAPCLPYLYMEFMGIC